MVDEERLVEKLKPIGLPVYRWRQDSSQKRVIFHKADLLFEETPAAACERSLSPVLDDAS